MSNISQPKIILASSSFLRKKILDACKLTYSVISPEIDEDQFVGLSLIDRVHETALLKCKKVSLKNSQCIVIAADTLTQSTEDLTIEDKKSKLQKLPIGQSIKVVTVTCVYVPTTKKIVSHTSEATIFYAHTSKDNLDRLLADDERALRSGSLGIYLDSPGFGLIENISGSYTGSFGLEAPFIYDCLDKINYFKK